MPLAGDALEMADTSVWAHSAKPEVAWFLPAVENGQIAVCDMVAMEILYTARDAEDYVQTEGDLGACPWYDIEPADWAEARRVRRELTKRGPLHHRQVKHQDLLIAAVAARNSLTVVHYDSDYDIIASVTMQPTRWAAPRGSLDPTRAQA
ncbi:type II toxin-antitoxin system toxin ribonuclease C21 [soil metagenome]